MPSPAQTHAEVRRGGLALGPPNPCLVRTTLAEVVQSKPKNISLIIHRKHVPAPGGNLREDLGGSCLLALPATARAHLDWTGRPQPLALFLLVLRDGGSDIGVLGITPSI